VRFLATGLLLSGAIWAQPTPVIHSETRVVLVDAVVTGKKGEYVRDLAAKNFRVWEDGKEQAIQSLTLESAAVDASQTSYLVLAFDYASMDAGDQIRARQTAARFIDANIAPDRQMAVANFDGALRIAQGFTANAGRLKDAISGSRSFGATTNDPAAGTSATVDLGAREMFRSLQGLAANLGPVPGRKTIVLLTGSLTVSNSQQLALTAAIEACNKSNVAVYPVDVRNVSQPVTLGTDNGTPVRAGRGVAGMGRGGRGGPAGDTEPGAAQDPGGASQQVLFALANGTGGFVIRDAGEILAGLQKIGQEQKEYYVLSYTPPESKEGTCHTLRVKVDRSGATVRARSRYCTEKAPELLTGSAADRDLDRRASAGQAGNIAASMQVPYFYADAYTARVYVAMNIAPEAVKLEHRKGTSHGEVNILATASNEGDAAARFADTLTVDVDDADLQKWKVKPLRYEKEFKIAPGAYTLTVAFSSGGENFGKLEQALAVAPFEAGQLAVSGVAFGKEIRKASDAAGALFDDRTPLVTGGVELIPAGSNVFTKPEKAYCYLEAYSADSVTIRILDGKSGEAKWDGGTMKLAAPVDSKFSVPVGLNIPIESLAPGSYRLEVSVAAAEKSLKRIVDFEVR
jgi:VWFA-related protein